MIPTERLDDSRTYLAERVIIATAGAVEWSVKDGATAKPYDLVPVAKFICDRGAVERDIEAYALMFENRDHGTLLRGAISVVNAFGPFTAQRIERWFLQDFCFHANVART